jgi:hypothetical protein
MGTLKINKTANPSAIGGILINDVNTDTAYIE